MRLEQAEKVYAAAAAEAAAAFPVAVRSLELVNVSENIAWRVTDDADRRYVLRLHRPGYHTLDELISERAWIRALDDAGIQVPQGIRTHDGAEYATVHVSGNGETRHAGLAHWTDGEVLAEVLSAQRDDPERLDHWFLQLGALIAGMHEQASTWEVPANFTRHALDADGLMGQQPFWGRFWEHTAFNYAERALLARARERLHAELAALPKTPDVYSVIHADMHYGNLLACGEAPQFDGGVLAVIDFDDAGFGWHVYDIAVALRPFVGEPFFEHARDAVLQGYRSRRPFSDAAAALIPTFLLVRRLASIGWAMQRPELGIEFEPAHIQTLCADVQAYLDS